MKRSIQESNLIEDYFDRLWPLARSITGVGVRATHNIINDICPLKTYEVPSGTSVLDWVVPKEWRVNHAYLIAPNGKKILDFDKNNLHLLNYSVSYSGSMLLKQLQNHLYSIPEQPDAIPYRTSYYDPQWGFCLSHSQRTSLEDGVYRVEIDTEHFDGSLTLSEAVVPGESDEEVVFTSYTCHPSLAINELSGPLITAFLYRRIAAWERHRLTYRFLFAPETIGAICYLQMRGDILKEKLQAGYVVTCVGDDSAFSLKRSKRQNTQADRAAQLALEQRNLDYNVVDFSPSGSDERQYCSIGYNLAFASLSRSVYGKYPEYHTSLDNKDLMKFHSMVETLDVYESIAENLDKNVVPVNKKIYGEPQMSKYSKGIYSSRDHSFASDETLALKWLLHFADGRHDMIEISKRSGIAVGILFNVSERLRQIGVF